METGNIEKAIRSYAIILDFLLENHDIIKVTTDKIKNKLKQYGIDRDNSTIVNDLSKISEIFSIVITKEKGRQSGWIIDTSNNRNFDRIFQTYYASLINNQLTETISKNKDLGKHIILDTLNNIGLKNIPPILRAINSKKKICIEYKKDNSIEIKEYILEPYVLKSYLNRWYLISEDTSSKVQKVFSLDRIQSVEILKENFNMPDLTNVISEFTNNIGIRYYKNNTEKVVIRFYENQHKYFLSEPWLPEGKFEVNDVYDENGKLIKEQKDISFTTNLNNELHQRILFNNVKCKVLEPKRLADKIKEILINTLNLYK